MKTNFIGAVILFGTTLVIAPFSATADALDNWTTIQVSSIPFGALDSVTYGNGRYVAVGYNVCWTGGSILTSVDGVHWTPRNYPATPDALIFPLNKVTYGNGKFVAGGKSDYGTPNLYCSTNGIDWPGEAQARGPFDNVFDVTYGNGQFVAVGDNDSFHTYDTAHNICTSPDGINWTPQDSGAPTNAINPIASIAFGAGRFVAVGVGGYFYTSVYGTNWTRSYVGGGPVNFCNGLFVSYLNSASNLISTDGLNWSLSTNLHLIDAIYANGTYFSMFNTSYFWNTNIFTSTDGTNWVERNLNLPSTIAMIALVSGGNNVVLVGLERKNIGDSCNVFPAAIISDPFVAVGLESGFPPRLKVSGMNGRSYQIDYTDNLFGLTNNWQPLMTRTLTNSPTTWTDTTATNAQRFYRAVLLP